METIKRIRRIKKGPHVYSLTKRNGNFFQVIVLHHQEGAGGDISFVVAIGLGTESVDRGVDNG